MHSPHLSNETYFELFAPNAKGEIMQEAAKTFCKSKIFDEEDISVSVIDNEDPKSCFALNNPHSSCEIVANKVIV